MGKAEIAQVCLCGSGQAPVTCHPDISPQSRAGKVLRFYRRIDDLIKAHYAGKTTVPPCRKGCTACCYHGFSISHIEYKLIERELRSWPQEKLRELFKTLTEQYGYLAKHHPDYLANLEADGTGDHQIELEQAHLTPEVTPLPCPLLNTTTGECSVYAIRPFICRSHGVTFLTKDDYQVCEHIPSNRANSAIAADARALYEEWAKFHIPEVLPGMPLKDRRYPILYFLKLTFQTYLLTGKIEVPREERDFRKHSDAAAKEQARQYFPHLFK